MCVSACLSPAQIGKPTHRYDITSHNMPKYGVYTGGVLVALCYCMICVIARICTAYFHLQLVTDESYMNSCSVSAVFCPLNVATLVLDVSDVQPGPPHTLCSPEGSQTSREFTYSSDHIQYSRGLEEVSSNITQRIDAMPWAR